MTSIVYIEFEICNFNKYFFSNNTIILIQPVAIHGLNINSLRFGMTLRLLNNIINDSAKAIKWYITELSAATFMPYIGTKTTFNKYLIVAPNNKHIPGIFNLPIPCNAPY